MVMMMIMVTMMMQSLKEEEEEEEEEEESGWTQYLCGSTTMTTSTSSIWTSAGTAHDEDHVNSGTSKHFRGSPKVPIPLSRGFGYGAPKMSDMYMSAGTREDGGRAQKVPQKDAATFSASSEEEQEEAFHSLAFRPFYLELDEHLVEQARALLVADATSARPRHHGLLTSPQRCTLKSSSMARAKCHPCDYHMGRTISSSSSSSIVSDASSPSNSKRQRKAIGQAYRRPSSSSSSSSHC